MTRNPVWLGIDGGGTRTDLVIVAGDGNVLVRHHGPTSNQSVVGFDQAVEVLIDLITAATSAAAIPLPLTAGWIGLAGSDRPEDRAAFHQALSHLVENLRITNDAELVLAGTPDGTGIALIAGTGSIAFARNADGITARSGGWGHIFGDEGSAYGIAVDGLRAVAAAADGRGPATRLTAAMLDAWRADTPAQLIRRVYAETVKKADIAATAPLVLAAAEQGDPVAQTIVHRAGDELAALVMSLARRVPFTTPPPVACTGGMILRSPELWARISAGIDPELACPDLTPIDDIAVSVAQAVRRDAKGVSG